MHAWFVKCKESWGRFFWLHLFFPSIIFSPVLYMYASGCYSRLIWGTQGFCLTPSILLLLYYLYYPVFTCNLISCWSQALRYIKMELYSVIIVVTFIIVIVTINVFYCYQDSYHINIIVILLVWICRVRMYRVVPSFLHTCSWHNVYSRVGTILAYVLYFYCY